MTLDAHTLRITLRSFFAASQLLFSSLLTLVFTFCFFPLQFKSHLSPFLSLSLSSFWSLIGWDRSTSTSKIEKASLFCRRSLMEGGRLNEKMILKFQKHTSRKSAELQKLRILQQLSTRKKNTRLIGRYWTSKFICT